MNSDLLREAWQTDVAVTARFTPIPRQTVASAVRDAIEREIRSGQIPPGAPLPAERELSEQFDVARTSVREAVQGLLTLGLIEKRGNRSYVVEHLPEVRLDPGDRRKVRVRELFAVRQILELPIARLAAENAVTEQRSRIAELAASFDPNMSLEDFRRLDREFHWAMASSCGNELLAELGAKVLDSLFASGEFSELLYAEANNAAVSDVIAASVLAHQRLADAIVAGDVVRAEHEMQSHLDDVECRMTGSMN